ncbi:MAG: HD domain-containing protein, partial [Candidatus Pacebacteria bacterium]|nr:HD domain-containing protein [Candidatus Paceibacterota bacterium]
MESKLQKIKEVVEKELSCSAHSLDHITRVYNLALNLAKGENVDMEVLEAAVLLHDIARVKEDTDPSGNTNHALLGAEMAEKILIEIGFSEQKIKHITECVRTHRNKGNNRPQTIEAKILFDADKLDSLGCIGIARAFAIGGQYGQKIYSDIPLEDYIKDNLIGGTIDGKIKDVSNHTADLEFETDCKFMPQKI